MCMACLHICSKLDFTNAFFKAWRAQDIKNEKGKPI